MEEKQAHSKSELQKRGGSKMITRNFFQQKYQRSRRASISFDDKSNFSQALGWQKSEHATSTVPPETPEPLVRLPHNLEEPLHIDDNLVEQLPQATQKQKLGADSKIPFMSGAVDQGTVDANICIKHECLANENPHRHQVDGCKEHPYCIAEPLKEDVPIHTRLPEPLPIQGLFKQQFLQEVEQGVFAETGPQHPDRKTIVTQKSLDHYWAQQWNLDIEHFPASLPEPLLPVQKLFYRYAKRGVAMNNVTGGAKATLAKKLRQWGQSEADKKQRDLLLLYSQTNDPRLWEVLIKSNEFVSKNTQQKEPPIGKYTPVTHFAIADDGRFLTKKERDEMKTRDDYHEKVHEQCQKVRDWMIPMSYYKTEKVTPVIQELEEEYKELIKKQRDNPGQKLEITTEQYYNQKRLEKTLEYNKFLLGQRLTANKKAVYVTSKVKKRMESEYLNSFMQQMEIQEIAERYDEFQEMLAQKLERDKLEVENHRTSNKKQSRADREKQALSLDLSQKKETLADRLEPSLTATNAQHLNNSMTRSLRGGNTIQSQQQAGTESLIGKTPSKTGMGTLNESTRGRPNLQRFRRPISTTTTSANTRTAKNQAWQKTHSLTSSKPRLFSAGKRTTAKKVQTKTILNSSAQEQQNQDQTLMQPTTLVNGSHDQLSSQHSDYIKVQNVTLADRLNRMSSRTRTRQQLKTTPQINVQVMQSVQSSTNTPSQGMKTFTITVRPNHRRGQSDMPKQERNEILSIDSFSAKFPPDHSMLTTEDCPAQAKVFKDILSAQESEKGHLQKVFRSARWQSEKDMIVSTMAFHLQKYKPVIRRSKQYELKLKQQKSGKYQGQSILQRRLGQRYGVTNTSKSSLPSDCQTFLSEVPTLLQSKLDQDNKAMRDKKRQQDACRQDAYLQRLKDPVSKTTLDQSLQTQSKHVQIKEGDQCYRTDETLMTKDDKFDFKVPVDTKPDVLKITAQRIQNICTMYVDRVLNFQKQYKATQATCDDPFAAEQSAMSSTKLNSPVSAKNASSSKAAPKATSGADQFEQKLARNAFDVCNAEYSKLEPISPGIGSEVTGSAQRQVVQNILSCLDDEFEETSHEVLKDMELLMPEFEWDSLELYRQIQDMESMKFWQQRGLQCAKEGEIYAAMDYYRQGLRKIPHDHTLIYSLAVCYMQLKKYHSAILWFGKGVDLHPRWLDGLCGIALAYFNLQNFERALKFIILAKDNSKGSLLTHSKLNYEIISFIHATCLKMTRNLKQSCHSYIHLEDKFQRACSKDLITLLWGLVLIPLSDERKVIADHYHYLNEYLTHLSDLKINSNNKHLLLTKYCIGTDQIISFKQGLKSNFKYYDYQQEVPHLNFDKYPKAIWTLLGSKSFFRRFKKLQSVEKRATYEQIMRRADVELYGRDQVVFLKDRIGIVTSGSVEIRRHQNNDLLKPFIVKKAIEGDILGWSEGDCNYSSSPLSWIRAIQDDSEVVFVTKEDWQQIWNLQRTFPEQQIVLQKLEQNCYFRELHTITKYHFVYESLEMKVFYPGQLIMSVHQRSPLCTEYYEYYKDGTSKFRREIDNKIMKSSHDEKNQDTAYKAMLDILNSGKQSKALREKKSSLMLVPPSRNNSKKIKLTQVSESMDDSSVSVSKDGLGSSERKKAPSEQNMDIEVMQVDKVDCDGASLDSNSTDYGVDHGKNLIASKANYALKVVQSKIKESIQLINHNLNFDFEKNGRNNLGLDPVELQEPRVSKSSPGAILNVQNSLLSRTAQANSLTRLGNHGVAGAPVAQDLLQVPGATRWLSPDQKGTGKRTLGRLETQDVLAISAHRVFKSQVRKVSMSTTAELEQVLQFEKEVRMKNQPTENKKVMTSALTSNVVKIQGAPKPSQEVQLDKKGLGSLAVRKQATSGTRRERVEDQASYNFLMQKQIDKIEKRDEQAIKMHKQRKSEIKSLIAFAQGFSKKVCSAIVQKKGLKRMLTTYLEKDSTAFQDFASRQAVQQKRKSKTISRGQTSGLNNMLLIDRVQEQVDVLTDAVEQVDDTAEDLLYQVLVKAVNQDKEVKQRRQDANGVYFIDSGEVLVVGKNYMPHTRLNKCDSFGFCDILRKTGPEFLGDVRAGIRQVQSFYISYEELNKRLTIPEKIKLKTLDTQAARFESVINFVQARDKVPGDKLRRF